MKYKILYSVHTLTIVCYCDNKKRNTWGVKYIIIAVTQKFLIFKYGIFTKMDL